MSFLKVLFAVALVAILSQGCGGGGGAPFLCTSGTSCGSASSGSSSSGGTTTYPEAMGAVVDGTFQAGVIGTPGLASGTQLAAGGSTQLSLAFEVTKTGAPATDSITVQFTSKCPTGTTTITPASATNTTGSITATYASAGGCDLTQDTVTATVTAGGTTLTNTTATATIALAQAQANSIVFLNATPSNIGLQGTGQATSSVVTFQVVTAAGGPVANSSVSFSLSTTLGGVSLVGSNPAITGSDGKASITVQAGTRAQSVVVTATTVTASGKVAANSNSLTVTTGIPDATKVSLSVGGGPAGGLICPNVEAWSVDGVLVQATMRMKDRFSNPVPDGTPVNFLTSGGGITGQCLTATNTSEGGLCSVNWVSQDPRPVAHNGLGAGRVRVLAVAVGEKHFTDNYGLGYFVGPPEASATNGADPITPLTMTPAGSDTTPGDPYLDADELGAYQLGDQYFDINNSPTWQADTANYVGLLCGGPNPSTLPTLCNGKNNSTTYVGSQATIVMSSSAILYSWPNAPAAISVTSAAPANYLGGQIVVYITDINGNPMPAGTTIALSGLPSTLTSTPSSQTWGCDTTYYGVPGTTRTVNGQQIAAGAAWAFNITDTNVTGVLSGSGVITVTTPAKVASSFTVPLMY